MGWFSAYVNTNSGAFFTLFTAPVPHDASSITTANKAEIFFFIVLTVFVK